VPDRHVAELLPAAWLKRLSRFLAAASLLPQPGPAGLSRVGLVVGLLVGAPPLIDLARDAQTVGV
jgi:hypothetical protein